METAERKHYYNVLHSALELDSTLSSFVDLVLRGEESGVLALGKPLSDTLKNVACVWMRSAAELSQVPLPERLVRGFGLTRPPLRGRLPASSASWRALPSRSRT
jgi:hypothetical protein